MAKNPAFTFYPGDFLTGTMFFTNEQVGKYIRLLCAQHQHGHLSLSQMQSVCGGNADALILEKFTQDSDGNFFNQRLEDEILKKKEHSKKQRNNAAMRWQCHGNAVAMPLEDEDENEKENEKEKRKGKRKGEVQEGVLVFPYTSPEFKQTWDTLANEPKWRKKTPKALQMALKILSEHPEPTAIKMMENAITGSYQGLFPINNANGKITAKQSVTDRDIVAAVYEVHRQSNLGNTAK